MKSYDYRDYGILDMKISPKFLRLSLGGYKPLGINPKFKSIK